MVFRGDRAGRLVDAQEFEHLQFDLARFSTDLHDILLAECGRSIEITVRTIVVGHAYIERRVIPLDIYLRDADPDLAAAAIIDYGWAIKELAAAGTFPGDLLLKNFGVTRHGRVVFYDYDEIMSLARCVFRELPESVRPDRGDGGRALVRSWPRRCFSRGVLEFSGGRGDLRQAFLDKHSDLFTARWWRETQRAGRGRRVDRHLPVRGSPPARAFGMGPVRSPSHR